MHPNVKALIEREYAAKKSEEWLKLRGHMLTASDAATAIGKNPYETPHKLLLKKCGLGEKFMGNAATKHGEKYEDDDKREDDDEGAEKHDGDDDHGDGVTILISAKNV